jgi:hypothetical protein
VKKHFVDHMKALGLSRAEMFSGRLYYRRVEGSMLTEKAKALLLARNSTCW